MANTRLHLGLRDCSSSDVAEKITKIVRAWAENAAKGCIKHIRSVRLGIHGLMDCMLSFSMQNGLSIALSDHKYSEGQPFYSRSTVQFEAKEKQLQDYIATIDAERKVLDLRGESIILTIIRDPEVWIWEQLVNFGSIELWLTSAILRPREATRSDRSSWLRQGMEKLASCTRGSRQLALSEAMAPAIDGK